MILKISKSSQNDLKSDFVKSSIKMMNTLAKRLKEPINFTKRVLDVFLNHGEFCNTITENERSFAL
jgi:hypothetical protein